MTGRHVMTHRHRRQLLCLQGHRGGQSQKDNRKQASPWHLVCSMRHAVRMIQANSVFSAIAKADDFLRDLRPAAFRSWRLMAFGIFRLRRPKAFNRKIRQETPQNPKKTEDGRNMRIPTLAWISHANAGISTVAH